jgi:outer membrane protein
MSVKDVLRLCVPVLLALAVSVPASAEQVIKLGYVDVGRVFNSYMKTKTATKDLDEAYNRGLKGIDARKSEIEDLQNELRTKENILSQERKDALSATINEKLAELREFAKEADDKLQGSMDQRTRAIIQEVRKIVEQIATADGYSVVFDKTVVLYVAPAFDLTQRVLDELNRSYAETQPVTDAASPE